MAQEAQLLITFIRNLQGRFKSGQISVGNFQSSKLHNMDSFKKMDKEMSKVDLENIDAFGAKFDAFAPVSSGGNGFGFGSEIVGLAETAYKVNKHGVSIERRGKKFHVKNGKK
ncbi:hypothetical protein [Bacillus massilinigeriensis]|uniref:hypothetical protein n=1 Tax=Bacillus mediterraneensis TaxID=1805474 RepID=UPI0008F8A008|nr:hypothetical protein [Bacillus mediterraneensis]